MAKTLTQEFTKGLWKEIPPFRLVLGICPTLGCSKSMSAGFGMGVALIFVLVCSNILISMLRRVIPSKVRIACFIVIVATFVCIVEMVMQAYMYTLFQILGIFIPLIVVNCIPLGRAEAFAYKNGVIPSTMDGLGLGIGYTMSLSVVGAIRELLGTGSLKGDLVGLVQYDFANIFGPNFHPLEIMQQPPGAFICLGLLLCIMNMFGSK